MARLLEKIWLLEFHWHLARATQLAPRRDEIRARTQRYERIAMPGTDRKAAFNRHMATCLLAATEHLEQIHGLRRDEAVLITRRAFLRTGRTLSKTLAALWLGLDRTPFESLQRRGIAAHARWFWGNGMVAEDEVGPEAVTLSISQCPFTDFFWNAGRPDLAETICQWDQAWMAQVNRLQKGLKVYRKGALAQGCEECTFVFEPAARQSHCPRRRGKSGQVRRPM